ncbi:hypothetical protein P154DRAFT_540049 [Amniculicola lignicola CBS 123094]|uniref:Uncharacterized protein n=1 Tax=Amniculicola lignicola CBS 123094 TaxID=1392246 RepID=A0A6A5VY25_9PLEO|nr:hypothetical protein P154DRAFT_540049 [Amniculicola lignicola CBS 123094]
MPHHRPQRLREAPTRTNPLSLGSCGEPPRIGAARRPSLLAAQEYATGRPGKDVEQGQKANMACSTIHAGWTFRGRPAGLIAKGGGGLHAARGPRAISPRSIEYSSKRPSRARRKRARETRTTSTSSRKEAGNPVPLLGDSRQNATPWASPSTPISKAGTGQGRAGKGKARIRPWSGVAGKARQGKATPMNTGPSNPWKPPRLRYRKYVPLGLTARGKSGCYEKDLIEYG